MNVFVLFALVGVFTVSGCAALSPYASTIRPPAYPLAVRTPHASIWLPRDQLPGTWPTFWTGTAKGWTGFVRVDGVTYEYMGSVAITNDNIIVAQQISAVFTPTQTTFEIKAGGVNLKVTFLSPVEYNDVDRQSIPLSYVFVDVTPNDGATHNAQLYMDITGEWASSDLEQVITWGMKMSPTNNLKIFSTQLQTQYKFAQFDDYPMWGDAILATSSNASHASGADINMRGMFITLGSLDNENDDNFRCVKCDWPTFAFAHNLGNISGPSKTVQYVVGHVREENINLRDQPQKALWTHFYSSMNHMIEFFYDDVTQAVQRAETLDTKILTEAFQLEGQAYADIVSLSLRQAFGGTELSGNRTHPLLYLKEISSNGNMQTVDVIYPTIPVFYYLNVQYLKYLLEPLFNFMEEGFWTLDFSMHDIGEHFPNATGDFDTVSGTMPVEESANMILMVGDIVLNPSTPLDEGKLYAETHYSIMAQWAEFLYHNCLYPVNQLTTDDFIGPTELNSGLALKGILGLKTFAKISKLVGNVNASDFYDEAVGSFIDTWVRESMHLDGSHLKMEYNVSEGYQFKYNAFQDKLLGLNTIPQNIYEMEAAYYLTKEEPYGIPFVSTHDFTKTDWEMWTAAAFGEANPTLRSNLVQDLARYLKFTKSRVPFSDWYVTVTSSQVGFQARPVVGGHFALLALNNPAVP